MNISLENIAQLNRLPTELGYLVTRGYPDRYSLFKYPDKIEPIAIVRAIFSRLPFYSQNTNELALPTYVSVDTRLAALFLPHAQAVVPFLTTLATRNKNESVRNAAFHTLRAMMQLVSESKHFPEQYKELNELCGAQIASIDWSNLIKTLKKNPTSLTRREDVQHLSELKFPNRPPDYKLNSLERDIFVRYLRDIAVVNARKGKELDVDPTISTPETLELARKIGTSSDIVARNLCVMPMMESLKLTTLASCTFAVLALTTVLAPLSNIPHYLLSWAGTFLLSYAVIEGLCSHQKVAGQIIGLRNKWREYPNIKSSLAKDCVASVVVSSTVFISSCLFPEVSSPRSNPITPILSGSLMAIAFALLGKFSLIREDQEADKSGID